MGEGKETEGRKEGRKEEDDTREQYKCTCSLSGQGMHLQMDNSLYYVQGKPFNHIL